MKKTKIILLMLVTFLFSGCTVKYNLYINEDLSVNEEVVASEATNALRKNTGLDTDVSVNLLLEAYKKEDIKYNVSTIKKDNSVSTTVSTSFKSLEDYEDYFESDLVKEVNITKKDSYITLEYNQDEPLTSYSSRSLIYDTVIVNIEVPFKVYEHNADSVSGNIYTWNIKKDEDLKNIKIKFNTKETKTSRKFDLGFFEIDVKYSVLFALGIVLVIAIIIGYVYMKNKKNNVI